MQFHPPALSPKGERLLADARRQLSELSYRAIATFPVIETTSEDRTPIVLKHLTTRQHPAVSLYTILDRVFAKRMMAEDGLIFRPWYWHGNGRGEFYVHAKGARQGELIPVGRYLLELRWGGRLSNMQRVFAINGNNADLRSENLTTDRAEYLAKHSAWKLAQHAAAIDLPDPLQQAAFEELSAGKSFRPQHLD